MSTPKDASFKLRQAEFRRLNNRSFKPGELVFNQPIEHKKTYPGKKELGK